MADSNQQNSLLQATFAARIQDLLNENEKLSMRLLPSVTPQKINELTNRIRVLCEGKYSLEKENKDLV